MCIKRPMENDRKSDSGQAEAGGEERPSPVGEQVSYGSTNGDATARQHEPMPVGGWSLRRFPQGKRVRRQVARLEREVFRKSIPNSVSLAGQRTDFPARNRKKFRDRLD